MRDVLMAALIAQDDARPRTQQVEVGPSALGGCRRKVMYQLHGTPHVNETERLGAIMGTAIHTQIEDAFTAHTEPGRYLLEVEVPGIPEIGLGPGHIDCYDTVDFAVNDWKTSTKKNKRYFPKLNQRWQVQVYGLLMTRAGYRVDTVRLISIARDGTSQDIVTHEEPYDEDVAYQAMDWLYDLYRERNAGTLPEPEMSGPICYDYCPFYDADNLCPSKAK